MFDHYINKYWRRDGKLGNLKLSDNGKLYRIISTIIISYFRVVAIDNHDII
ncbi:MAG: hypothetical protein ACEY29_00180 [Arsenophonus sp.]